MVLVQNRNNVIKSRWIGNAIQDRIPAGGFQKFCQCAGFILHMTADAFFKILCLVDIPLRKIPTTHLCQNINAGVLAKRECLFLYFKVRIGTIHPFAQADKFRGLFFGHMCISEHGGK